MHLVQFYQDNSGVSRRIDQIREALDISHGEMSDALGISLRSYNNFRTKEKAPSIYSLNTLLKKVHLSAERFMNDPIDFVALKGNYLNLPEVLPERYKVGAHSRRRTSINILKLFELTKGKKHLETLLPHFQIKASIFENPDSQINIVFLEDLCAFLAGRGFSEEHFFQSGIYSAALQKKSFIGQALSREVSLKDLHERVFSPEFICHYDENHHYSISELSNHHAVVKVFPRSNVKEVLKRSRIGSHFVCTARAGTFASLATFIDLTPSTVVETQCIHRGDPECSYDIRFASTRYS